MFMIKHFVDFNKFSLNLEPFKIKECPRYFSVGFIFSCRLLNKLALLKKNT